MEQQIEVTTTLPVLSTNFEAVSAALDQELSKYEGLVVTVDNIKSAKKDATAINKLAGEIDKRRKAAVSEVSEPIKVFEDQMKRLRDRCKDVRQKLIDQVDVFEDQVREQVYNLLTERQSEQWDEQDVDAEFRTSQIDDLANLSAVTNSGKLSKAARDAVDARVAGHLSIQNKTYARLAELEVASYRAGLAAPLSREHVESFLFEQDQEVYTRYLEALLSREVERQKAVEAKAQQEAEAKARHEVEQARRETEANVLQQEQIQKVPQQEPTKLDDTQPYPESDGKVTWEFTVTFRARANADTPREQLRDKVLGRLASIGLKEVGRIDMAPAEGVEHA